MSSMEPDVHEPRYAKHRVAVLRQGSRVVELGAMREPADDVAGWRVVGVGVEEDAVWFEEAGLRRVGRVEGCERGERERERELG